MTKAMDEAPLHSMDPLNRFSGRAEAYARYRPDYPAAAIDFLVEGLPHDARIADVGAGTGISSRMLAERGFRVLALEPNRSMLVAAETRSSMPRVEARAEWLPLGSGTMDCVAAFQSFHWFEPGAALEEFWRVLRSKGTVAIVWNERAPSDPFTRAYTDLIREVSGDHPAERRMVLEEIPFGEHGFELHGSMEVAHEQRLDLEQLIGRASSTSYLPSAGREYQEMVRRLTRLHGEWSSATGEVVLRYRTRVNRAMRTETNRLNRAR